MKLFLLILGLVLAVAAFFPSRRLLKLGARWIMARQIGHIPGLISREWVAQSIKEAERRIPWHVTFLPSAMCSVLVFLAYVQFVLLR